MRATTITRMLRVPDDIPCLLVFNALDLERFWRDSLLPQMWGAGSCSLWGLPTCFGITLTCAPADFWE